MTDPLKILDEIEREGKTTVGLDWSVSAMAEEWQSLRTALEAQADELAHIETELATGQGDDDGDQILPDFREDATTSQKVGECLHLLEVRRDVIEAQRKTLQIKDEELVHLRAGSARIWKKLAQKEARIARLELLLYEGLQEAESDDDCAHYNDKVVIALKESPAQSLAAIKAEKDDG